MKQNKTPFKVIGLTGGVGSGKTFIAEYANKEFHVPVILADQVGHLAYEPGCPAYKKVIAAFGGTILKADKSIDRTRLAEIVFGEEEELRKLNHIVHPFVEAYIKEQISQLREEGRHRSVIVEAAILLTSSLAQLCDEIWYVKADLSVRKKRLKETRGYSEERIKAVMASQLTAEEMEEKADKIIVNNRDLEEIHKQLEFLLV